MSNIHLNQWASQNLKDEGYEMVHAYFVYRFPGKDGLTYDVLVECDYFTPNGEKDGTTRWLKFPCPVCEERFQASGSAGGVILRRFDVQRPEESRSELTFKYPKHDFDVNVSKYVEFNGKKHYGLVSASGRRTCPYCVEATEDQEVFDVVFVHDGLALAMPGSRSPRAWTVPEDSKIDGWADEGLKPNAAPTIDEIFRDARPADRG